MKYLILFLSMILAILGQIILKAGMTNVKMEFTPGSIIHILLNPMIILGFIFYGASSILWLFVLQKFPISLAAPMLSLSYILLFFYGLIFLKETHTFANFIGIFLIFSGIVLLNIK